MNKKNNAKKKAKQHLLKARRLLSQTLSHRRNEKEMIASVRQTREAREKQKVSHLRW